MPAENPIAQEVYREAGKAPEPQGPDAAKAIAAMIAKKVEKNKAERDKKDKAPPAPKPAPPPQPSPAPAPAPAPEPHDPARPGWGGAQRLAPGSLKARGLLGRDSNLKIKDAFRRGPVAARR